VFSGQLSVKVASNAARPGWGVRVRAESIGRMKTNRYRRDWDEDGKADWPDSAADIQDIPANTRVNANLKDSATSLNIVFTSIIRGERVSRNPIFFRTTVFAVLEVIFEVQLGTRGLP
jgi:hypothetical protein